MAGYQNAVAKVSDNVKSVCVLTAPAASMRRILIFDWSFGCKTSSIDTTFEHIAQRCTTAGTGTTLVCKPLDPSNTVAASAILKDAVSADPTLTAGEIMLRKPLNGRNTFRWLANPGRELVIPPTATNGYMFGLFAASTELFSGDLGYEEQ